MSGSNHSLRKEDMDALAALISAGIARHGIHVLDERELAPIWDGIDPELWAERRLQVENFAVSYSFDVHVSTYLRSAIFRVLDDVPR